MCACECVCLKPNRDGSHWAGRKQVNLIMCVSERTPPLKNRCSFVDLKTVMISNYQIITVGISVKSVNWHVCPSSKLPSNAEKWLMNGFFFWLFFSQSTEGCAGIRHLHYPPDSSAAWKYLTFTSCLNRMLLTLCMYYCVCGRLLAILW